MSTPSLSAILHRMKSLTGATTDAELSKALGISPQTLSSWKIRESIPYALCMEFAQEHGLSLDWLLLGDGQQNRTSSAPLSHEHQQAWEADLLEQLRALSALDLQAIRASVQDKLRISQLERRLEELTHCPASQ
ncbi:MULTISPECIES: helix-turn-helix domain-containing protein [Pseudomonas]|uniref:helix-turn-helix domain-containing protein n=1 Tax=Pseudomonas TaxID=286 RepID=UPI00301DFCEF